MREVVIVGGAKTAIGNYLGALQDVSAIDLGITALKGATKKVGVDAGMIHEVVAGQCNQASVAGLRTRLLMNRFNFFNPTLGGEIMHEFIGR